MDINLLYYVLVRCDLCLKLEGVSIKNSNPTILKFDKSKFHHEYVSFKTIAWANKKDPKISFQWHFKRFRSRLRKKKTLYLQTNLIRVNSLVFFLVSFSPESIEQVVSFRRGIRIRG